MPITDTLHEKLHERFDFFTSLTDPSEGVCIELVCSSSERTVTYDAVPLAHVSVKDVVDGKWTAKTWIDVPGLSGGNSKVLVSCFYTPFQRSLRTIDTQHSPGGEFVGGNCDLTAEEIELGNYAYPGKPLSGVKALSGEPRARAAAVVGGGGGGGEDAGAGADDVQVRSSPAKKGMQRDDSSMSHEEVELGPGVWQRLLPRSMFRGVVWITVHEGADLQPKMIGTRDPYVKAKVGQQVEKTEAVVDSLNPTFEQELCLFVSDPVNNTVQLSVHQNDVALGRHITDDSIGTHTVSLKQLISDKPEHHGRSGSWSGWVTLENAKRGRIRITLKYETLQDAIQVAKEFGGATCGQGMGLPVSVSHRPPTLYGILQVLVLGARDLKLDSEQTPPHQHREREETEFTTKSVHLQSRLKNLIFCIALCFPCDSFLADAHAPPQTKRRRRCTHSWACSLEIIRSTRRALSEGRLRPSSTSTLSSSSGIHSRRSLRSGSSPRTC